MASKTKKQTAKPMAKESATSNKSTADKTAISAFKKLVLDVAEAQTLLATVQRDILHCHFSGCTAQMMSSLDDPLRNMTFQLCDIIDSMGCEPADNDCEASLLEDL